jgi:hypothetical protein
MEYAFKKRSLHLTLISMAALFWNTVMEGSLIFEVGMKP